MFYQDAEVGFSFELPDGWRFDSSVHPLTFFGPNGAVGRYTEVIQINPGVLQPMYETPESRTRFLGEPGAVVRLGKLGDESNVVVLDRSTNGEISALHGGIHYNLTYANDAGTKTAIERLTATFRFPAPELANRAKEKWKAAYESLHSEEASIPVEPKKEREELLGIVANMAGMLIILGILVAVILYLWRHHPIF